MSVVLGFAEAMEVVRAHAAELRGDGSESMELLASAGRVLAEEVIADRDQPPFDRATRDGFAVRAEDWRAGMRLRVKGVLRAGEAWRGEAVGAGEAVEIMTGAALPAGADAVVMVEHAEQAAGEVWAAAGREEIAPWGNVVAQGSEARAGDVALGAETLMRGAEIAVAATCGCSEVRVRLRPKVAIVATGDELVEIGERPGERQIRNSNGYALAALVEEAGGEPVRLAIARDTREDVRARIGEGMRMAELLVLSGGVSMGKYDLVEEVLAEFGAEFLFTGVRMQPGKPVVFGRLPAGDGGRRYFFGLPGNPVSTQVTFHCFVEPMLRAMGGEGWVGPRFAQATLGEDVRAKAGLTRLLPARLTSAWDKVEVRLVGWQGSGDLAANARANCYAVLPDGREMRAGDAVQVLLR